MGEERRPMYQEYARCFVEIQGNMSNQELARLSGVDYQLISYYRNGHQRPHLATQDKLLAVLQPTDAKREQLEYLRATKGGTSPGTVERAQHDMAEAQEALNHPHLISFLQWLYPHEPFLKRCGVVYPALVYPAQQSQWAEPESILAGGLDLTPASGAHDIRDATCRNTRAILQRRPDELTNDPTFTMRTLRTDGRLESLMWNGQVL